MNEYTVIVSAMTADGQARRDFTVTMKAKTPERAVAMALEAVGNGEWRGRNDG